nr:recombinase family protein [Streptomyces himalayensis]
MHSPKPHASGSSPTSSPANAEREELWKALDYLREGDTLVVPSLDRLGRSIQDLIAIVSGLRKRGIGFNSLHEALDTTTPRRAPGLPRVRGPGGVHPRTHRAGH